MPLTPDDVVTKQFQHVRFKEGFDPDEVDDFLDEIVVEWRKALAENEELKARIAELESGAPAAPEAPAEAPAEEAAPVPAAAAPASTPLPTVASAGLLELAQRLHDEHVAEGQARHDQLIAEAQAQAASIISDAETRGRDEIARMEAKKAELDARIGELREFERDYRSQLRGFIEGHLKNLDASSTDSASVANITN